MDLVFLKRTRKLPREGDIFAWRLEGQPYRFGRVIRAGFETEAWDEPVFLVYCYRTPSEDVATVPQLSLSDLLVPPFIIDRGAWTHDGVFMTIAHRPLQRGDVLEQHCFWCPVVASYVDEQGRRLRRKTEPCGFFAIPTTSGLAYDLAKALGFDVKFGDEGREEEIRAFKEKLGKVAGQAAKLADPQIPAFKQALRELLDEIERIGRRHDELYDTIVREQMAEAILRAFVFDEPDYELPREFGMESRRADAAVRRALERYIDKARRLARRHGLRDPAQRLRVFEDLEVTSRGGETYDEFFGASL